MFLQGHNGLCSQRIVMKLFTELQNMEDIMRAGDNREDHWGQCGTRRRKNIRKTGLGWFAQSHPHPLQLLSRDLNPGLVAPLLILSTDYYTTLHYTTLALQKKKSTTEDTLNESAWAYSTHLKQKELSYLRLNPAFFHCTCYSPACSHTDERSLSFKQHRSGASSMHLKHFKCSANVCLHCLRRIGFHPSWNGAHSEFHP